MTGAETGRGARVAVLLSGGVDSAVAALLLRQAGAEVLGLTIRTGAEGSDEITPASHVAESLRIPFHVLDLREDFRETVLEPFRAAYRAGRTPNPCVACNPAIKFGLALQRARVDFGATVLATGHYARVLRDDGHAALGRARDAARDQSYFLYRIPRERLGGILFPLGDLPDKSRTREIARAAGLPAADRAESMDLCFLPGGDYRRLFREEEDGGAGGAGPERETPGEVRDARGNRLGTHEGVEGFTIGQRRGLGVALGEPAYVIAIDPVGNTVTLGTRREAETRDVRAIDTNVLRPEAWRAGTRLGGRIRSSGPPVPCVIRQAGEDALAVRFDQPVFAPAPGQHLVLYDEADRVVGGGEII
jgi:tRNA-specific 2-thiouridylase